MPQRAWSPKRERQYEHIKDSERDAGRSTDRAEAGETKAAQRGTAKKSRSGS